MKRKYSTNVEKKRISKQTESNLLIILGTFVFTVALIIIMAQNS